MEHGGGIGMEPFYTTKSTNKTQQQPDNNNNFFKILHLFL